MDREAEALGAARHRLADAAHADDAQALPVDAVAEHAHRPPALPLVGANETLALRDPARGREDQRHGHVGRILGEDARACW